MAHRNRWVTVLKNMVIFHGELLVITKWYINTTCVGVPVTGISVAWNPMQFSHHRSSSDL